MPANTSPIFINSGNFTPVRITVANTTPDASSTTGLVTLVTAGANGTRVDGVRFRNASTSQTAASSAMVHRVYLYNGVIYRLVGEVATGAVTRSATAIGATSIITFDQPLILDSGQSLVVSQSVVQVTAANDQFDAIAFAGDY
jgi:hypothetical protein